MTPRRASFLAIVADNQELVRSAICAVLSRTPDVRVLAEARHGYELLSLLDSVSPDLIITDIAMPHLDGLAAIRKIRERNRSVRILVVSARDSADLRAIATANGACAFLRKDTSVAQFEAAIRELMAHRRNAVVEAMRTAAPSATGLTGRQLDVLRLMARGNSSKQIAAELEISPATVDVHRGKIGRHLGIRDKASLTRYALQQGLIEP